MKNPCTCEDCTNPNDDPLRAARGLFTAGIAGLVLWIAAGFYFFG